MKLSEIDKSEAAFLEECRNDPELIRLRILAGGAFGLVVVGFLGLGVFPNFMILTNLLNFLLLKWLKYKRRKKLKFNYFMLRG